MGPIKSIPTSTKVILQALGGVCSGATVLSFLLVHWQVSQLNLQELIYSLLLTKQYEIPFPVCLLSFQANKIFH